MVLSSKHPVGNPARVAKYRLNSRYPFSSIWSFQSNKFLQVKAKEATKQKEEKRKKLKPEEHEGMP
jgi:hypothetical protein